HRLTASLARSRIPAAARSPKPSRRSQFAGATGAARQTADRRAPPLSLSHGPWGVADSMEEEGTPEQEQGSSGAAGRGVVAAAAAGCGRERLAAPAPPEL
ncbi:unnamed protein product, partial [Urochloa humidicola]